MLKSQSNQRFGFLFFLPIICIILAHCSSTKKTVDTQVRSKASERPCWLYQPVKGDVIGAIGIAKPISAGADKPIHLARLNALMTLTEFFNLSVQSDVLKERIAKDETHFIWGTKQIRIVDHYRSKSHLYAYAVSGVGKLDIERLRNECRKSCKPETCEPAWLCEPMTAEVAGFLGVSDPADTLSNQYKAALLNGALQANYLYGVTVESAERFVTTKNSLGVIKMRQTDSRISGVDNASSNDLRFLLAKACFKRGKLYAQIICPDLRPLPSISPKIWMGNPNTNGYIGAIGSVRGMAASGLLSDKIKLAIKRGIVDLAKGKNISVSDNSILKISSSGGYYLGDIETKTSASVNAKVMGIFVDTSSVSQDVYVWVVEKTE